MFSHSISVAISLQSQPWFITAYQSLYLYSITHQGQGWELTHFRGKPLLRLIGTRLAMALSTLILNVRLMRGNQRQLKFYSFGNVEVVRVSTRCDYDILVNVFAYRMKWQPTLQAFLLRLRLEQRICIQNAEERWYLWITALWITAGWITATADCNSIPKPFISSDILLKFAESIKAWCVKPLPKRKHVTENSC